VGAHLDGETADFTCMCLWAVTEFADLLLLDVERVRFDMEDLSAAIQRNHELHCEGLRICTGRRTIGEAAS
jgi:hypothetical protein